MRKIHTCAKVVIGVFVVTLVFAFGMLMGHISKDKQRKQEVVLQQTEQVSLVEATVVEEIVSVITVTPAPRENVITETNKPVILTNTELYTYDDMIRDLVALQAYYPEHLKINELAQTVDNRQIMEVIVGNENAPKKIVIQASIHGREYLNTLLVMKQIEGLLDNYETGTYNDVTYKQLLASVAFHIIPMSNPDGVTISQFGVEGINSESLKSNLEMYYDSDLESGNVVEESRYWARWKANAQGVDLNRNFESGWETFQGNLKCSSEKYKGKYPASEVETQVILELVENTNAVCVVSYHSSGNLIYWDYGSEGDVYNKDRELAEMVSNLTGYSMQSTVQSATDAAGCSDYFVLEKNIPAITIENGAGQCPLALEEFDSIWYANQNLLPALATFYK